MKRVIEEDGENRFTVTVDGADRAFLALSMIAVSVAMVMTLLWPGDLRQLVAPWRLHDWGHSAALVYSLMLVLVGVSAAFLGMYFGEWKRAFRICFDGDKKKVITEEWWQGKEIETTFDLGWFSSVQLHQKDDEWRLGVVLENGSYWLLLVADERHKLEGVAQRLESLLDRADGVPDSSPEPPAPVDIKADGDSFEATWKDRSHRGAKLGLVALTTLCTVAAGLPAVVMFDGPLWWLAGALALAVAPLGLVATMDWKTRGNSIAFGASLGAVVAAVFVVEAHWVYFPMATLGVWVAGSYAVSGLVGLWKPRTLSLEIGAWGEVYRNQRMVQGQEGLVRVRDVEGAVTNVRDSDLSTIWLLEPGGREKNIARRLGQTNGDGDEHAEPIRVLVAGLSLFERIALSFVVDEQIQRRHDSDEKRTIRVPK